MCYQLHTPARTNRLTCASISQFFETPQVDALPVWCAREAVDEPTPLPHCVAGFRLGVPEEQEALVIIHVGLLHRFECSLGEPRAAEIVQGPLLQVVFKQEGKPAFLDKS